MALDQLDILEFCMLTVMSYDRYLAICSALYYEVIMDHRTCIEMAATFSLPFCRSHVITQFFCDIPSVIKLSCSKTYTAFKVAVATGACFSVFCFVSIVVSYVRIFRAVLRMPASEGRAKAFSTCLPHIVVVTVFISTAAFAHLKPTSSSSFQLDLLVSVFYTVVPPIFKA
ncbi:olfactory receptor 14A2-like [Tachyglossus aculeatus]|uniref:olfactory receptor 14A2-like n=1 Tax=Tachyglossus aculeatus TaxID=9261 RepID=UPI0018F447AD|nr:olfactory receptor 14A2-like [Tachyglossus aculeatus]